jgi:hypothetical protein
VTVKRQAIGLVALAALGGLAAPALAEDACATFAQHAGALLGERAAKPTVSKRGKGVTCELRRKDDEGFLSLVALSVDTIEQELATNAAKARKLPGQAVRNEPALGPGAYQMREKDGLLLQAGSQGVLYSLSLFRETGVTAGDEERMRALVKRLVQRP